MAQDLWQCNQFYKIQLSEDLLLIKKTWKHTGNWQEAILLKLIKTPIIYKFFRHFTNHKKKKKMVTFSHILLLVILQYRDHRSDFQQSAEWNSFRHILQSSASMNENSNSHWFTTGVKSGPRHDIDKSKLVMTFFNNLGETWILHSFRLVLERRAGKEILETSRFKFSENLLQIVLLYKK